MKDQDMSCKELYEAYDLSEKHKRKWLVKIARYWLKNSINEEANKIINDTLEVVERYIRGEATQKELEEVYSTTFVLFRNAIFGKVDDRYYSDSTPSAAYGAYPASCAAAPLADVFATAAAYAAQHAYVGDFVAANTAYKEALLKIINEMDELEQIIRRKI